MTLILTITSGKDEVYIAEVRTSEINRHGPPFVNNLGLLFPGDSIDVSLYEGKRLLVTESKLDLKTAKRERDADNVEIDDENT